MDAIDALDLSLYIQPDRILDSSGDELGSGSFGAVYALDDALSATIEPKHLPKVVKVVPRKHTDESVFTSEVRVMQTLWERGASYLPQFCGWSEDDKYYYLVMERIYGITLERWAKKATDKQLFSVGLQLLTAARDMYDAGIVQRDIKGANLLVGWVTENN